MNRYFYYLVILEFINGIISITPSFLYESSNLGAITSMLVALAAGYVFLYVTTNFFNFFPGMGLPEILQHFFPKWITIPLLLFLSAVWFLISLKTLFTYSFLLKHFLTPDLQMVLIVMTFLSFLTFSFFMKSKKLLYTTEMILLINIPIILYIVAILYNNGGIGWDYIMKAMMHANHPPNYFAFSSAFFIFLGVANLSIFNREFKKKQKMKWLQLHLLVILALSILFTLYFIPIGYNGFDHIQYINFPWMLTTDSVKVAIAFLERMMYIFLFLYLSLAFSSIIITWHVSMEFLKSTYPSLKSKQQQMMTYFFVLLVWSISVIISMDITETKFLLYSQFIICILPPIFLLFILICGLVGWRKKHENYNNT